MNLTLKRNQYRPDGIFGQLLDESNEVIAVTLEHAYQETGIGAYKPKLPQGTYTCVRGQHQLAHMTKPFETFEITNVPGHSDILLHVGNYNDDSEGCVLVGRNIIMNQQGKAPVQIITSSQNTFNKIMDLQRGLNQFTLTVI